MSEVSSTGATNNHLESTHNTSFFSCSMVTVVALAVLAAAGGAAALGCGLGPVVYGPLFGAAGTCLVGIVIKSCCTGKQEVQVEAAVAGNVTGVDETDNATDVEDTDGDTDVEGADDETDVEGADDETDYWGLKNLMWYATAELARGADMLLAGDIHKMFTNN